MNAVASATNTPAFPLGDTSPVTVSEADQQPDDEKFWSVTRIEGARDQGFGLDWWKRNTVATAAVREYDAWRSRLEHEGEDSAVKYLADATFRRAPGETRTAADLGSDVHRALERYTLDGRVPHDLIDDEVRPFFEQAARWLDAFAPTIIATECAVFNDTYRYAGTLDLIAEIDGDSYIIDYKTSRADTDRQGRPKKPYGDSVALQLAAYRYAEMAAVWRARRVEYPRRYYLLNDAERSWAQPVPEVDGGLAVLITPERCEAYPVACGPEVFRVFLHCLEIFRWNEQGSKRVVGSPLIPPPKEA